jgi:branched-chain amino acid aminotransferase
MSSLEVAPEVAAALKNFVLPDTLGFGLVNAPVMFSAQWRDQKWGPGQLLPYGPIEILPGARALHYGEVVFEGLKAYRVGRSKPNLFRPDQNFRRMERSAQRLAMPPVGESLFFEGLETITRLCADFIPARSGQALYLRPFLFLTESG